jgi:thiamine-phosphate pyrophosphorylase
VGTTISTAAEQSRSSLADVAIAAGKRLSEALRVIEESSKTIDASIAARVEALRYRAYELDRRLSLRLGPGGPLRWRLCLLLTKSMCKRPWREVLDAAIRGGADCVQVREKEMDGGVLAAHVREVIALARPMNVSVIVNDRADVALATGADGVHVGQNDLSVHDVRRLAGRTLLVGVSTHDLDEAMAAVQSGADYCGVGAMFATATKHRDTSGIAYLKRFIARFPSVPHLAIGGITPDNVREVAAAGAKGIAVSSAICGAEDVFAAAQVMRDAMRRA